MLLRRFAPLLVSVLLGALATGCAEHPKPPTAASATAPGRGVYKVGKPYQVGGVWYYPSEDLSYDETGIASWYGKAFDGQETANGEVFDLNGLTAAHRTLPLPSVVQVTNLENGRTLKLRVNDRGPFARGRIIDVSRRAAQLLGFEQQGTAKVRVKLLVPESIQVAALAGHGGDTPPPPPATPAPRDPVVARALPPAGSRPPAAQVVPAVQLAAVEPASGSADAMPVGAADPAALPQTVGAVPVHPTQIYIQAGAFSRIANASRVKRRLQKLGPVKISPTTASGGGVLYRVRLGPIASVADADRLLARVVKSGLADARIVVD